MEDCPWETIESVKRIRVCTIYQLVSDNSNQNGEHAAQCTKFLMQLHKAKYPHLQTAFGVSDKAGDFSGGSFVTAMLIANVSLRTGGVEYEGQRHSASGEGKGKPDNYTAYNNKKMKQLRVQGGAGSTQTTATQIADAMNLGNIKGQLAVAVSVAPRQVPLNGIKMPDGISRYHERARTDGDASTILAHEYNAIGTGIVLSVKASAAHITTLAQQVATPMTPAEASCSSVPAVTKVPTHEEAQAKKQRAAERLSKAAEPKAQSEWTESVQQGRSSLRMEQQEIRDTQLLTCEVCQKQFSVVKKKDYDRHVAGCNAPAPFISVEQRAMDEVGNVEATLVEEAKELKKAERTVSFSSATELLERLELVVGNRGALEVVAVNAERVPATLSLVTYVIPGSVLLHANKQTVCCRSETIAETLSRVSFPADVCFGYPLPAPQPIGWARYVGLVPQVEMTEEQTTFLYDLWDKLNTISAALLAEQMEQAPVFAGREHLHMEPYEIQNYLHRLWDAKKKRLKRIVDEAEGGGEEASAGELNNEEEKDECFACYDNTSQECTLTCGNAECEDTYHEFCLAEEDRPVEYQVWLCPNCKEQ